VATVAKIICILKPD